MRSVLASVYRDDSERALAKLSRILDRFDELDERILDLQRRIDLAMEAEGTAAKEVIKLRGELSSMRTKRDELHEEVARVSKLAQLQPEPGAKKAG
jgi:chromosome segregation ATPase